MMNREILRIMGLPVSKEQKVESADPIRFHALQT